MSKTVVGIFDNQSSAENAARQIKDSGLKSGDISILAKQLETNNAQDQLGRITDHTTSTNENQVNDNISDGVVSGTVLGGLAGLVIGLGTIAIPGLGVIAAAGPIVGLLSGAVTGGVVGGLVDLGIPEENSRQYETEIRHGRILLSAKCEDINVDKVSSILRNCGTAKVEVY